MPYLWEQPNLGNNLYEMAINANKARVEAIEDNSGEEPETTGKETPAATKPAPGADPAKEDIKKEGKDKEPGDELDPITKYAIKAGFNQEEAQTIKQALYNAMKTGTFDGKSESEAAKKLGAAVKSSNPEIAKKAIEVTGKAIKEGKILADENNPQLYAKQKEEKKVSTPIEMPAMFEAEPDDSMWNEMIVNDFGMPIINLSHPAVAKIIKSDNPEEECPGDLKAFKKAVYGDKRLTAVFGEGGLSRVVLGKMANLLTLGIAGATLDAGKRADRIIKELHEKGGQIAHRNLLFIDAEELLDADADNDELKIPAVAYSRPKKTVLGKVDVPATALAQFYSAVDPIKSAKIYIEILASDESLQQSLNESIDGEADALVEGKGVFGRIAGAARGIQDKFTGEKATTPKSADSDKLSGLTEKWVSYLENHGRPPFYVLKPKSANKEVDVISTSATGHAGTSGGKVNMVTMKIGDHKGATFMSPKEINLYFA